LYLSAVIPAAMFERLGDVLAVTGAVGGSCLSYIGKNERLRFLEERIHRVMLLLSGRLTIFFDETW
jgi:hypothetical protein